MSANVLVPAEITVRLVVASYQYSHLAIVLRRYPTETALASTSALIARFLDDALSTGQNKGGNIIISWDYGIWGLIPWISQKA